MHSHLPSDVNRARVVLLHSPSRSSTYLLYLAPKLPNQEHMTNKSTATDMPTSTGKPKPSGTGSVSPTGTSTSGDDNESGDNGEDGEGGLIPSATGEQLPESTGAAGRLEVGVAALLAGLGVMAVL